MLPQGKRNADQSVVAMNRNVDQSVVAAGRNVDRSMVAVSSSFSAGRTCSKLRLTGRKRGLADQ